MKIKQNWGLRKIGWKIRLIQKFYLSLYQTKKLKAMKMLNLGDTIKIKTSIGETNFTENVKLVAFGAKDGQLLAQVETIKGELLWVSSNALVWNDEYELKYATGNTISRMTKHEVG